MTNVTYGSPQGRGILLAAILGSGMAMLDGTVVNVALKVLGTDLDASLQQLQWISNGYLMSLAALILLGGSLGDLFGRRRVFQIGVIVFTLASVTCGIAPTANLLILARIVQGVGGALLTPGSLAMIQTAFAPADRGRAIGAWSGLGGIAAAIGPFIGGGLVEYANWRWAFLINVPIAAVTLWAARRFVPETRSPERSRVDLPGALLACAALAGLTFALIEPASPWAVPGWVVAAGAGIGFLWWERRSATPMVPLELFGSTQFSGANAMTLLVYAAFGAVMFFLSLQLQVSLGYGPLPAGLATLPVTIALVFLASRFGQLSSRIGPRLPMTIGPVICALGTLLLAQVRAGDSYLLHVFPGISIFGFGVSMLVAPLTATVLAAAPDSRAGIASGINNAVARTGSLLAVAALPTLVGLSGAEYTDPATLTHGYRLALTWCAVGLAAGGVISWLVIRNPEPAAT